MRTCIFRRGFAALLIFLTLSALLLLPCGAAELPDGVKDAIGDAIGDAVNGAVNDAADNLKDTANDILDGVGEALPLAAEIAEAFLAGKGVEASNLLLGQLGTVMQLIVAAVGIVLCFYGYRFLRFAIVAGGFSAGWILSMGIYGWLLSKDVFPALATAPSYMPYLIYAACGLLGVFLAFRLVKTGMFLAAAAGTFLFLSSIGDLLNPLIDLIYPDELAIKYLIAQILLALLVGLLSRALLRPILIFTTSAAGGMTAAIALMVLIGQTANPMLEMIVGMVAMLAGLTVQILGEGKRKRR